MTEQLTNEQAGSEQQTYLPRISIPPFPEAGGVAWTDVYTRLGQKISITSRKKTLKEAIDDINESILYAHENYGWVGSAHLSTKKPVGRSAPTKNPVTGRAPARPAPKVAKTPKPVNVPDSDMSESVVVKYAVSKDPDGRGRLTLYEAGHKWPDFTVVSPIPAVVNYLANVPNPTHKDWEQAIVDGEEGTVQWTVFWKHSDKLKQTGEPYKNVQIITPF